MTKNDHESNEPQFARPYWLPDVPVENLPEGLQLALEGIVGPGYQDLVMGARGTMERLAGISAVHLAHLEILDQIELANKLPAAALEERQNKVASHVRLVGAKLRALAFLQRLREARGPSNSDGQPPQRPADEPKS